MAYVFLAVTLFGMSVAVHIFYCRQIRTPGLQAKLFGRIAVLFLAIYTLGVSALPYARGLNIHSLWGAPFKLTGGLIFILLAPVYLCFYVLTQLTSPSKKILLTVSQGVGVPYKDILSSVQKEDFIAIRLNDLCVSGCVAQADGRYTLTAEGQKIAFILNIMQAVLGRNAGG